MNIGTKVHGELIADERLMKNHDLQSEMAEMLNNLKKVAHKKGLKLYELHEEILLKWGGEGKNQIRRKYVLILSKKMTTNEIYAVTNSVYPNKLTIINKL